MIFIETPIFTADWKGEGLTDEQLRSLQNEIMIGRGAVIPGSGGLRKVRMARTGKGKSVGYRVIYYIQAAGVCYLVYLYAKNDQANLTPTQAKMIKKLLE